MKKGLIVMFTLMLFIAACFLAPTVGVAQAADKLTVPVGITLIYQDGSYALTWGQIVGNKGYTVEIDGETTDTAQNVNYINADFLTTGATHNIRVKALSADGTGDSEFSAVTEVIKVGKLSAPTNVAVDGLVLSWDEVSGATGYKVTINGVIVSDMTTSVSLNLSDTFCCTGDYAVKIKAIGDNVILLDSDYSAVYTYTHQITLETPANLSVVEESDTITASWDKSPYATSYELDVDGTVYDTVECNYDVTELVKGVSDHAIKVRAKESGNYLASEYSSASIYSTTAEIENPVITINGDTASWTKPTGAERFSVVVISTSGEIYKSTEYDGVSLNMATVTQSEPAGEYVIYVQALENANYLASDIVSASYIKYEKLSTPVLTLSGTTVSWTAVDNAINYTVKIDGRILSANLSDISYDFAAAVAESKDYVISVSANAVRWYTGSDTAQITYTHAQKLGKTDLTSDGMIINWTSVLGANTYVVTVDGEKVAEGITALSYDLSSICTENKEYVIGVYAEATDGYSAGDVATISVTGLQEEAYNINYVFYNFFYDKYLYYVDGEKTELETEILNDNRIKIVLPSTAKKLIVVTPAELLTTLSLKKDGTDENYILNSEIDLASAEYFSEEGIYKISANQMAILQISEIVQPAGTAEGYAYIEYEGIKYYYHVKEGGLIPTEIG